MTVLLCTSQFRTASNWRLLLQVILQSELYRFPRWSKLQLALALVILRDARGSESSEKRMWRWVHNHNTWIREHDTWTREFDLYCVYCHVPVFLHLQHSLVPVAKSFKSYFCWDYLLYLSSTIIWTPNVVSMWLASHSCLELLHSSLSKAYFQKNHWSNLHNRSLIGYPTSQGRTALLTWKHRLQVIFCMWMWVLVQSRPFTKHTWELLSVPLSCMLVTLMVQPENDFSSQLVAV